MGVGCGIVRVPVWIDGDAGLLKNGLDMRMRK